MVQLLVGLTLADGEGLVGMPVAPLDLDRPILLRRALRIADPRGRVTPDFPAPAETRPADVALESVYPGADDAGPILVAAGRVQLAYTPGPDLARLWHRYWDQRPRSVVGRRPLPQVPLAQVVDPAEPVVILEPEFARGNVSVLEMLAIAQIARRHRPRACFEIGTFDGRTTLNLAANSSGRIFTLDLPAADIGRTRFPVAAGDRAFVDKPQPGRRFQASPLRPRIVQLLGDSASFDYGPHLGRIDLVFVDGSHAYDYVRSDLDIAHRLLRRGAAGGPVGTILVHDYGAWEGVTLALEEARLGDSRFAGLRHIAGTSLALARFDRR